MNHHMLSTQPMFDVGPGLDLDAWPGERRRRGGEGKNRVSIDQLN